MIGSLLGNRYELVRLVQEGPVFTSYVARDQQSEAEKIVYLVRAPYSGEEAFLKSLQDTVEKVRFLDGPRIEAPVGLEGLNRQPYLIASYERGVPLAEKIRRLAPFSVAVAVSTAISIAEGLEPLHARGTAHGDLRNQTVQVLQDGQVRLQLPGVWEAYSSSARAGAAVLPGMAPYLAPEVSRGAFPSPASDMYALGVLLHELLTARLPFNADNPSQMAARHASEPVPSLRALNPSVPVVLDELVKKLLAKDPGQRYRNAEDVLQDLQVIQDALRFGRSLSWPLSNRKVTEAVSVAPKMSAIRETPAPTEKPARREGGDVPGWMLAVFGLLVVGLLTVVGAWVMFNLNRPKLVTVPNIRGTNLVEARQTLKDLKLDLRVSSRVFSNQYPAETVLETSPPAGDKVKERSFVQVRISAGSKQVQVPDVTGLTIDEAKTALAKLNLELAEPPEEVRSSAFPPGQVVSQSPPPKTTVDRYSIVRARISSGTPSPGEASNLPKSVYRLQLTLEGIPEAVQVRVTMTDAIETKQVFDEVRPPNSEINLESVGVGEEVVFNVYYNNELKLQIPKKASEAESTVEDGSAEPEDERPRGRRRRE